MNKYIYAECPVDYWPEIKTIMAKSYNDAVEKLINSYSIQFEDDNIANLDNFKLLREYLNDKYTLALSDLEVYEEI